MESERRIRRGDIYFADLPGTEAGSVQACVRPILVVQCNRLNRTSTTLQVAIITSKLKHTDDGIHVVLPKMKGLPKKSMVEAEQRKTIDKMQLLDYCCTLDERTMREVTRALKKSTAADHRPKWRSRRCGLRRRGSRK